MGEAARVSTIAMYRDLIRKSVIVTVCIAALTVGTPLAKSEQQIVMVPNAFMTGQNFIGMNAGLRASYVVGLYDGLLAGKLLGASEARIDALQSCMVGRNNNYQLAEVLYRYVKERPEDWHLGAHILFYNRLLEICPGF